MVHEYKVWLMNRQGQGCSNNGIYSILMGTKLHVVFSQTVHVVVAFVLQVFSRLITDI